MRIRTTALTPENVKPYGAMIGAMGKASSAQDDFTWYGQVDSMVNKVTEINLCAMKKHPFVLTEMEMHENTKEALVALNGQGIVLALAEAGALNPAQIRAFYIAPGDGIVLGQGTYHSTPFPVGEQTRLLVVFEEGTGANDLQLVRLSEAVEIEP